MGSATKVLLETIQVARHISRLGLRPLQKGAVQVAKTGEEVALWTLKLQPLEGLLGRHRTKQILDSYLEGKEVVGEVLGSLSHQSWNSVLQSGAKTATTVLQATGVQGRVIGPRDEHWNTLRVLKDLKTTVAEQTDRNAAGESQSLRLTPRTFVKLLRESQRKKRRAQGRDPIENYVEGMLNNGVIGRMGPMAFEKKLYTDIARVICFLFDRAVMAANGTDVWGHELHVRVAKDGASGRLGRRSSIGAEQVEAVVDRILENKDLKVPLAMEGIQKQLLKNCAVVMLRLTEDLTSDRHMQVRLLGHKVRVRVNPVPLSKVLEQYERQQQQAQRLSVNTKAIDELVDALLEEPEIRLVLVPDLVEAEVYRYALHRAICVAQFILSQLQIRLFGVEVHLCLDVEEESAYNMDKHNTERDEDVQVSDHELQILLNRLDYERSRIKHELHSRRRDDSLDAKSAPVGEPGMSSPTRDGGVSGSQPEVGPAPLGDGDDHEFKNLACQDRLSRSLSIHRTLAVPIDLAFQMVSDFDEYPKWMPFCTAARVLPRHDERMRCQVGFGMETGTILGTVGDTITYHVMLAHPAVREASPQTGPGDHVEHGRTLRTARVVADTADGFAYGKRLVYDWRFAELGDGQTHVRLDMFFQAKNVFYLPLWDSMQATITSVMMKKFIERAALLSAVSVDKVLAGPGEPVSKNG